MKNRDHRFTPEQTSNKYRTEQQVDRDRILYCPHLARLAEITQVRSIDGGVLVHNRLTHSLKVAQLARRIAEKLESDQSELSKTLGVDPDAAEAAGLAHDMGHPPFGHIAEYELNRLVREKGVADGYEGNAQTFRIVATLTVGDTDVTSQKGFLPGLNLTRATLNGILKYPWVHGDNPDPDKAHKWGAYETERAIFEDARLETELPARIRSVEAEIMNWAGDITYAIHDMTDFYCAGLIPLHLLAAGAQQADNDSAGISAEVSGSALKRFLIDTFKRREDMAPNRAKYERAVLQALKYANVPMPYDGTHAQDRDLWSYASVLIAEYIDAIELVAPETSADGRSVKIKDSAILQTDILKEITRQYVIEHSDLATIQYGQRKMIRELFQIFHDAIESKQYNLFPIGFQELIRDAPGVPAARWTADYISGLTERQVLRLHQRLLNPS